MNNNPSIERRPVLTQEWSLHAELTFSHQEPSARRNNQPDPNNRMHMQYLWNNRPEQSTTTRRTLHPCYGFQRGNILFTTTPPSHSVQSNLSHTPRTSQTVSESQQSPGSVPSQSHTPSTPVHDFVSSRTSQPYNRRCKSTCSIILSGDHAASREPSVKIASEKSADRGRSCSPVTHYYHTLTHRCGDPVCYHSATSTTPVEVPSGSCGLPPTVLESCEVCGGGRSPTAVRRAARANTFTSHFCTRVPERTPASAAGEKKNESTLRESKDAAIQTSDVLPAESTDQQLLDQPKADNKTKLKMRSNIPQGSASIPGTLVSKSQVDKKKSHSSAKSKDHFTEEPSVRSETSSPGVEGSSHKPRTVHIDVYCTGSEDADADTNDSLGSDTDSAGEGESWSSPQTVFESDKLRVVHKRASRNQLPQALLHQQVSRKKGDLSQSSGSFKSPLDRESPLPKGFDSDDGLTSQYPSKDSSYTTLQDAESSLQSDVAGASRDASWSTLSSALYSDGYDSATATSWKDTATEIDSLAHSSLSLTQSDSFDYADAIDRLRIREKERAWAGVKQEDISDDSKTWQCPQTERKRILQKQKLKEYVEKHLGKASFPLWKPPSCEDSDNDEDETGDTWSFGGGPSSPKIGTIKREVNIKKSDKDTVLSENESTCVPSAEEGMDSISFKLNIPHLLVDSGSLSDSGPSYCHRFTCRDVIGPFGSKSPSPPPAKLKSMVTLPFTTVPGCRTDQLIKAQKFGTIVGAFRKPGHHVGPSKNPDCACVHCREYYKGTHRGRARSIGAVSLERQAGRTGS